MQRDFDRRKRQGAGRPAMCGRCSLSILTGKFLFTDDDDDDVGRFMIRLTSADEELVPDFRRKNIDDNKEVPYSSLTIRLLTLSVCLSVCLLDLGHARVCACARSAAAPHNR